VGVVATLLVVVALSNLVYQVIHKPTELFFFVGHRFDKEPAETWRQYGTLFRTYSTGTITPELLAALAQGEAIPTIRDVGSDGFSFHSTHPTALPDNTFLPWLAGRGELSGHMPS
jgi:hypothetical protein